MNSKERAVRAVLVGQSSPERSRALYDEHVADECVWENTGFPTVRGKAEVNALLDTLYTNGYYSLDQRIINIATVGNVVLVERYEKVLREDRSVICECRIVGVFELNEDDKITAWRDYFDFTVAQKTFAG
jgi:limonene-1,2-epoxide hydrolase